MEKSDHNLNNYQFTQKNYYNLRMVDYRIYRSD